MYGALQANVVNTAKECVDVDRRPTLIAQLTRKQVELSSELARVNNAIEQLNKNPELAEVIEAINGVRFY